MNHFRATLSRLSMVVIVLVVLYQLFLTHAAFAETLSQYHFCSSDRKQLNAVAEKFEMISREGECFDVLVPIEQASNFQHIVPNAELVALDVNAELKNFEGAWTREGYRNFAGVNNSLGQLVKKYPALAHLEQYGATENGLPLFLLKISTAVNGNRLKPKVIVDAGTHGDELIGVETLLRFVEEMLAKYGTEERFTKLIDGLDITVVPVVNPEGYSRTERYSLGTDPNRDYPWPGDPEHKSVPCISALRDLFVKQSFVGSLTLHASGSLVMFPWGYTTEPISDVAKRTEMDNLTTGMSQANGYVHGPIATTIYVARGSSSDYYFWKFNTVAVAIELGHSKIPFFSDIPKVVSEVHESLLVFFEHFLHV